MLSRGSYSDMVVSAATRNALLKQCLDNLGTLTVGNIEQMGLQPWMRLGLVELKNRALREAELRRVNHLVDLHMVVGVNDAGLGEIRSWQGDREYIQMERVQIEIMPNKLLWMPYAGGFWYETSFAHRVPMTITSKTRLLRTADKRAYHEAYRAQINGQVSDYNPVIDLTNNTTRASAIKGVTFF